MGDQSVRFIKDSIRSWSIDPELHKPKGLNRIADGFANVPPPGLWQILSTRNGGEIVSE